MTDCTRFHFSRAEAIINDYGCQLSHSSCFDPHFVIFFFVAIFDT